MASLSADSCSSFLKKGYTLDVDFDPSTMGLLFLKRQFSIIILMLNNAIRINIGWVGNLINLMEVRRNSLFNAHNCLYWIGRRTQVETLKNSLLLNSRVQQKALSYCTPNAITYSLEAGWDGAGKGVKTRVYLNYYRL